MSGTLDAATATLLAAGIGVFGALAGLVVERLLRSLGRLWCEPSGTFMVRLWADDNGGYERALLLEEAKEAVRGEYRVGVDLFNGKEIPVGLRDIRMLIYSDVDDDPLVSKPADATAANQASGGLAAADPLRLVNLPPRQWMHLELGEAYWQDEEAFGRLASWRRVELVGARQKGASFHATVAEPSA